MNFTISETASNFVEYFVQYNEYVNQATDLLSDLSFQIQDINGLLSLLTEFKIKIPENYRQKVQESNASIQTLRKKAEEAQAQFDQNLTKCSKKLEKQVPEVSDQIKHLQDALYTSNLDDKNQDIMAIVSVIQELKMQIDDVTQTTQRINKCQNTLALEFKHFEKLEELHADFAIIERLWMGRKELHQYLAEIKQ